MRTFLLLKRVLWGEMRSRFRIVSFAGNNLKL